MTFGQAVEAMQGGAKVQRAGWNGKGMWVALTPGSEIPLSHARAGAAQHLADEIRARHVPVAEALGSAVIEITTIRIGAHIDMKAADGSLVIGWLASQTDMLATDWAVVA